MTPEDPRVNDEGEKAVPFHEYEVPEPLAAVFQPLNVYPVRVGRVEEMVTVDPKFDDELEGALLPPLASYATE